MGTRLTSVVIDSADPGRLAHWWAGALGWLVVPLEDERDVVPPPGELGISLTFGPVDAARTVKNRIHLDIRSLDHADQGALVERLVASGARRIDIGQNDASGGAPAWVVLADPEGNEFCVLDPRPHYQDTGAVAAIVVDCTDPDLLGAFWEAASGWTIQPGAPDTVGLRHPDGHGPWLEFLRTGEPHQVKNRLHFDVAPFADGSRDQELERLIAAGASRSAEAQAALDPAGRTCVALIDPEQNEFSLLSPR